jgi:hypothetical protein
MSALGLLLIILLLVLFWHINTRSRDLAIQTARHVCKTRGVQFLDGTAVLQSIRPVIKGEQGPGFRRTYTFDYSEDGIARRTGCIIMHNTGVSAVLLDD